MTEQTGSSSFEQALERDLERLTAAVKNQRERPELRNAPEQEILREAIRAFPETRTETMPQQGTGSARDDASPLPAYAEDAPAEVKLEIEYLLEKALREGIGTALDESKKAPYFVQDAFHDALAGRLYPELQRRGIVR